MKIYLVGGAVRDILMNEEPQDLDYVVVGSNTEEMLSLGFKMVSNDFPVFIHPETGDEYALARTERKIEAGYNGFDFNTQDITLEEDLLRRDLTINSIAMEIDSKEIIDPFNGKSDIENKILRATSESFKEDPLRVVRLARFQAKFQDFSIDSKTKSLIKDIQESGELKGLTSQILYREMVKNFKNKKPSIFFDTLKELLVLQDIFPLIFNLIGVPQVEKYHPEGGAYIHSMIVLDQCRAMTTDTTCLFACLLHDLGKAITPQEILPQHIGHEENGLPLVESFCSKYSIGGSRKKFILNFTKNHLRIHRSQEMTAKKLVKLVFEISRCNKEQLNKILICAKADNFGKQAIIYPQEQFLTEVLKNINTVNQAEIAKNTPPKQIKQKIHQAKVTAVKQYLYSLKKSEV